MSTWGWDDLTRIGGVTGESVMAIAFATLNHQILLRRPHLIAATLSIEERRRILARSITGLV
ncbi:MAG: hypothetical protein ACRDMJ_06800, partial [Solirubrobacteraceae bacterium]